MRYVVPLLVALGLVMAADGATAQDLDAKTRTKADADNKQSSKISNTDKSKDIAASKADADNKQSSKISNTDKSKDIAASKADADARAHNAATLSNKSSNEAKQAQAQAAKAKATGGSSFVKSSNHNDNFVKIGDIKNTNVNENTQNVTIGVPVRK
jgi:hypothetical protein